MTRCWMLIVLSLVVVPGCIGGGPSRVTAPPINANAGRDAIAALDKNGDGGLDAEESKAAPGLNEPAARARFDADGDGKITADEITARVRKWGDSKIGLTAFSLAINMDGRPLEGATVTLVPEPWLGEQVKAGTGTTDASGRVNLSIPASDLKPDEQGLSGMRLGIYKVEVTHPSMSIPAKYNTNTTLGVEVAHDEDPGRMPPLELTSR